MPFGRPAAATRPCTALVGIGRSVTSTPTRPVEAPRDEGDDVLLDTSNHCTSSMATSTGGLDRQGLDHREECRRDDPMVAWRAVAAGPQQHAVHCNTLELGQLA